MASDKSGNSTNVKIKVEPGTSISVPLANIKTEPGVSTNTTRLTSFRLPRDLTLGGNIKTEKPRRVYTPNLNAQRLKKKEETQNDGTKSLRGKEQVQGRGRGDRGHGRGDRGRGRGASNLVQSSGVWSSGIVNTPGKRSSGGFRDSDRSPQVALEKPKLDMTRNFDKVEEEEKVKTLLRDDFIEDEESMNTGNSPIVLPMIKGKICKEKVKVKVKEEQMDEVLEKKPILSENGEVLSLKKEHKFKILDSDPDIKNEDLDNIHKVIENKANTFVLMQFPDCLPGLVGGAEDIRPSRSNNANNENETKVKPDLCTLNDLKPGILGKLQILKSGKARLLLGENNLVVDIGSRLSFRQDLIAAKIDTEKSTGELINLGPVQSTLVCSPNWESMLAKL